MKYREAIIVFLRYPEPGKTKTRLIPKLGAAAATELYRKMAEHVVAEVAGINRDDVLRIAYLEPASQLQAAEEWLGSEFHFRGQPGGDLGARLSSAFRWAFEQGVERVIAIGSDCITLDRELLERALESLGENDAVVGPATDGGYYLIGMRRFLETAFQEIPWSSSTTCKATVAKLEANNISYALLPELSDVDEAEDLVNLPEQFRAVINS